MGFMKCNVCNGDIKIIGGFNRIEKIVKCLKCDFSNKKEEKFPEVITINKDEK